eukprot:g45687.t1
MSDKGELTSVLQACAGRWGSTEEDHNLLQDRQRRPQHQTLSACSEVVTRVSVIFIDYRLAIPQEDLITIWDMVNSCRAYTPGGVAAVVREPLLRNRHLHHCSSDGLSEGRAVAVGVPRIRNVLGGRGLGWILPQDLASRAAVDIWPTATSIQLLKTGVLGPDIVHQMEDAQACSEIPSARTPARTEFHIGPRIPYLPLGACASQPELHPEQRVVWIGEGQNGGPYFLLYFWLNFSPTLLIFRHPVRRGAGGSEDLLVGLLLGLAKL